MIDVAKHSLLRFFQNNGLTSASVIEEALSSFEEKELSKNDFFLKEGIVSNEYMILETGFLRAFTYDTEGNDVTTNFYAPGNLVLEVSSFFHRTPSRNYKAYQVQFPKVHYSLAHLRIFASG